MSTYFEYSFYEPGDSIAGIDTVITDIETALNDLPLEAIPDRSINREHFATNTGIIDAVMSIGSLALSEIGDAHTYNYGTENIDYSAYGTDGATDRCVVGSATGYAGGTASITGLGFSTTVTAIKKSTLALWVKGNVEVQVASSTTITSVMICVQAQEDGVWRTVDRTERFVSVWDHRSGVTDVPGIDVPIKTLLTASDFSGVTEVDGIRLMVSAGGPVTAGDYIKLNRWNLTVLPLRIGVN